MKILIKTLRINGEDKTDVTLEVSEHFDALGFITDPAEYDALEELLNEVCDGAFNEGEKEGYDIGHSEGYDAGRSQVYDVETEE